MQVLAFLDHFGIADDDPRVNPWGGAIAVGHPLASSGVRLMTQLARQFAEHPEVRYGITAMCIGIGMGGIGHLGEPGLGGRQVSSNEVVTRALVRTVTVKGRKAALITLDNGLDHTKPNTFGPGGLASLDEAITAAQALEPAFIAITGKPYIFSVGADITGMPMISSREQAVELGRYGHRVFNRLRESTIPTFAFVNGVAMGGGLEVTLHCHYRTLSAGAGALALPEVSLGLVPAWGGTQLLPNLIGIAPAAQVIIQNPLTQKTLRPPQARELGIADVLLEPADFLERSLEWAAGVVAGEVTVERPEIDRDMWDGVLYFAKMQLDERLHGAVASAKKALELLALAKDADFATGTAAEDEALGDLVTGAASCATACTRSTWCSAGPSGRRAPRTRPWPATSTRSASSAPG